MLFVLKICITQKVYITVFCKKKCFVLLHECIMQHLETLSSNHLLTYRCISLCYDGEYFFKIIKVSRERNIASSAWSLVVDSVEHIHVTYLFDFMPWRQQHVTARRSAS